jgi:16S rRNA (uracil1498-N3)-methyltransferase
MPRFHCSVPLTAGASLALPPGAARHVQVLRMQPGDALTLFDGAGGEYAATVERMGRSDVAVAVGAHLPVEREAPRAVHLAVGMPANERMDWLVEKGTELGVASIQPLATAHGVLRLSGERAEKKRAHWEAIAIAACEQCGRNRVPVIHPVQSFSGWIDAQAASGAVRLVLSLAEGTRRSRRCRSRGPRRARAERPRRRPERHRGAAGHRPRLRAGHPRARVLRAETAALAALVSLAGL